MEKNIDRYILLMKNATENLKNVMFWAFFCNPQALFKKISIILALFWQKKQALLSAFNSFFTSTFGKSLSDDSDAEYEKVKKAKNPEN